MIEDIIIEKIKERHKYDKEQLEVIFSEKDRILVEAPAGYGKTSTIISKIAYLLATGKVPNPKKILALTFSVNAAYKIKKDVINALPELNKNFSERFLNKRITATNYHGFARQIIRYHGYTLNENLKNINSFDIVEDDREENLAFYKDKLNLSKDDMNLILEFNNSVVKKNFKNINSNFKDYIQLLLEKLIPHKYVTYNGVLVLGYYILAKNENLLNFYKILYPFIIIDEFQDTNALGLYLVYPFLQDDKNNKQKFLVLGDPLQQIYGFIGSIPKLFNWLEKKFNFHKIELKKNYRFKENQYLLNIERNLRDFVKNPTNPNIKSNINLKFILKNNQQNEAEEILKLIEKKLSQNNKNIAILFRNGNNTNTKYMLDYFKENNIDYFYALFNEEDKIYKDFHKIALNFFDKSFNSIYINKKSWRKFIEELKKDERIVILKEKNPNLINSLIHLTHLIYDKDIKILKNSLDLPYDELLFYIRFIFKENQLKQYLKYIDKNVLVLTVHGAKGLEWDYVIIPDMEKHLFPSFQGLCQFCRLNIISNCYLNVDEISNEEHFYNEFSTFYVACTRAKEDLYFTASKYRFNLKREIIKGDISCFLKIRGFSINYELGQIL